MEAEKQNKQNKKRNKNLYGIKRPRQLHMLLFFVLLVIMAPIGYVGYNLMRDKEAQGAPVVGSRYDKDLEPAIDETFFPQIKTEIEELDNIESVSINLLASTLRVNINVEDNLNEEECQTITSKAWAIITGYYDIETYFTNTEESKMYDCELTVYNYIPETEEDYENYVCIKVTKTGAAEKHVTDYLHKPKDAELVKDIVRYDE